VPLSKGSELVRRAGPGGLAGRYERDVEVTTLLISGASGFIGRNMAEQLRRDYDVTAPSSGRTQRALSSPGRPVKRVVGRPGPTS